MRRFSAYSPHKTKEAAVSAKKYIYEKDEWPELKFDESTIRDMLSQVYHGHGRLFGKLDSFGFGVQNEIELNAVTGEIVASSAIEGERIDYRSVRSSVAKRLRLDVAGIPDIYPDHYTEGIIEMALDATQNYLAPITDERLFNWHAALFPTGRSGNHRITVAAYRIEGMQIVSGAIGNEKVHYKAPPPECVPSEMRAFLKWLGEDQGLDPFVKACLAHLRFESIHPFDDGNGRIGRAIADLLLARAEKGSKRYYSLSAQLLKERKEYYKQIERTTGGAGSIEEWLLWLLGCLIRAMESSEEALEQAKQKKTLFDSWRNIPMNERQLKIVNMMADGFEGKLTTSKWAKLCKCSQDTALRDIDDLLTKGVLLRSAEGGRSTSYAIIN